MFISFADAQRIVTELETNSDRLMDSRPDSVSSSKSKKIVPVDVYAWTIDETYGNITPAIVDTISHLYQNKDLPEGEKGKYNTLGNVGSPRMSRIFFDRPQMSNFMFTDLYDMFFVDTEHFLFYNTKSPFMNINYNWNGSKTTGSDHVKVTFTNNAGKRTNFGAIYDYIYGQGYYDNLSTSFMNASAWASHLGDKYNFHFYYQHNFMKSGENGGIEDEIYITNPEDLPTSYITNDIPTNLTKTWNRQEHDVFFFNHHYNIGFYREEEVDSATTREVFVPVSKIFHTLKMSNLQRNYRSYANADNFYQTSYLPCDTTQDITKNLAIKNIVGLSICEGFNKWAVFGLNAYIGHDYNRYRMPELISAKDSIIGKSSQSESNVFVGGQIIRTQGTAVHYTLNAEYVVQGENNGQFDVNGKAEVRIPLLGDTAKIALNAYIKKTNPVYYFRHYHGKYSWWDEDKPNKESRQRIYGTISIPHTKTILSAGVENIKNFCYFENAGNTKQATSATETEEAKPTRINNITPKQHKDQLQVISVNLQQNFRLGILNWENDVTFQNCTEQDILPLPKISLYTNLYLKFRIAKVLNTEVGADMRYFTRYNAPDYSPSLGMFMNQDKTQTVKIGNYPIISAYANFDLKRTRFYVQYYHANQDTGRYFWAPYYPMNPSMIRFGISWNFYD